MLITGGISAYKLPSICSALKNYGNHEVRVLATENTWRFVTRDSLLYSAEIMNDSYLAHIRTTEWADKVAIVPATYNTINKIAAGIADNELTSACAAIPDKTPKIVFPAMNTNMWEKEILQENIQKLLKWGWGVVEPVYGNLACGGRGKGVLRKTGDVVQLINDCKPFFKVIINRELIPNDSDFWYKEISHIPLDARYINKDGFIYLDPDKIPKKYDRVVGSTYFVHQKYCTIVYSIDKNYINSDIRI